VRVYGGLCIVLSALFCATFVVFIVVCDLLDSRVSVCKMLSAGYTHVADFFNSKNTTTQWMD